MKWEGLGKRVLRLHGCVPEGRAKILAGEYAGVEHYTIAALQAARARPTLSPALHGVFGVLSQDFCMSAYDANPFFLLSTKEKVFD